MSQPMQTLSAEFGNRSGKPYSASNRTPVEGEENELSVNSQQEIIYLEPFAKELLFLLALWCSAIAFFC